MHAVKLHEQVSKQRLQVKHGSSQGPESRRALSVQCISARFHQQPCSTLLSLCSRPCHALMLFLPYLWASEQADPMLGAAFVQGLQPSQVSAFTWQQHVQLRPAGLTLPHDCH